MNNQGYLEIMLQNLKAREKFCNKQLELLPEGTLQVSKRDGKNVYFQYKYHNGRVHRKSINKKWQTLEGLIEKELLKSEISILEKDIAVLESLVGKYVEPSFDNIVNNLAPKYKQLSGKVWEGRIGGYKQIEMGWYSPEVLEWTHSKYNQSDYMMGERKHKTSKGLFVRSKSELMIAEKLYQYGIPFRYEEALHFGDVRMIPDFVMPGRKYDFYYWEHCGMMSNEEYLANYHKKMKQYEKIGIAPWTNLIVTYDDEYGNIDMGVIESEIRNKQM